MLYCLVTDRPDGQGRLIFDLSCFSTARASARVPRGGILVRALTLQRKKITGLIPPVFLNGKVCSKATLDFYLSQKLAFRSYGHLAKKWYMSA